MVHDYAKRSITPPQRPKRRTLTIIVIALAIALPVTMYFVKYKRTMHKTQTLNVKKTTPPAAKPEKKATAKKTKYDFYTLLPKMAVPSAKKKARTQSTSE